MLKWVLSALLFAAFSSGSFITRFPSPFNLCGDGPGGVGVCMTLNHGIWDSLKTLKVDDAVEFNQFPVGLKESGILRLRRVTVTEDGKDLDKTVLLRGGFFSSFKEAELAHDSFGLNAETTVFLGLSPYGSNGFIQMGNKTLFISTPWIFEGCDQFTLDLNNAATEYLGKGWRRNEYDFATIVFDSAILTGKVPTWANEYKVPPSDILKNLPKGGPQVVKERKNFRSAIEADYELYKRKGSNIDAVAAFVYDLVGGTNAMYARDFGSDISIVRITVWTGPDPYPGDAGGALDYMRNTWDHYNPARAFATFIASKNLGGGMAYVRALCNAPYAYGVAGNMVGSFPIPLQDYHNDNWDLFVFAHEVGHIWGGSHTHDIGADGCGHGNCNGARGGTIMSYCHTCSGGMSNIRLAFHDYSKNEIVPFVNSISC